MLILLKLRIYIRTLGQVKPRLELLFSTIHQYHCDSRASADDNLNIPCPFREGALMPKNRSLVQLTIKFADCWSFYLEPQSGNSEFSRRTSRIVLRIPRRLSQLDEDFVLPDRYRGDARRCGWQQLPLSFIYRHYFVTYGLEIH